MGYLATSFCLYSFHEFYLDVSSLIVTTSAIVKKGKVKDETSKKICETDGGQIKEQGPIDLRFPTGMESSRD